MKSNSMVRTKISELTQQLDQMHPNEHFVDFPKMDLSFKLEI